MGRLAGLADDSWGARAARRRVGRVLVSQDLDVALQPILDLTDGWVVGVEALARFGDGRSPDLWFQDASLGGLGTELDALAFGMATDRLSELPQGGLPRGQRNAGPDP